MFGVGHVNLGLLMLPLSRTAALTCSAVSGVLPGGREPLVLIRMSRLNGLYTWSQQQRKCWLSVTEREKVLCT